MYVQLSLCRRLVLSASALLLFGSCSDSDDSAAEQPLSFQVSVSDATMTGATVTVDPSGEGTYYVSVDNRAEVDALCATDEEYIAMKLDFIRVMAGVNKLSVEEYLRRELRSGRSVIQETDLYYDTEYCVGVFGLDADGTVTTGLARSYFRTETFAPSAECQFIIQEVACTASSIEVEVGASDPSYTHTGRNRLLFEGLEASTEYVVIVFGISSEGEQTTEAATATFSTTAA